MKEIILILSCVFLFGFNSIIDSPNFSPIDPLPYEPPKYVVVYDIIIDPPLGYTGIGEVHSTVLWSVEETVNFYKYLEETGHTFIKIYLIGKELE
jgi:hypothetical protein